MADLEVVQESGSDIDNPLLIGIGLATTFAVVAIVYFVLALDQNMNHSVELDRQRRGADYVAYQNDQQAKLGGDYRWADKQKGLVVMPKEDAKALAAKAIPEWTPPPAPVKPAPAPAPAPEKKDDEGDEEKKDDETDKGDAKKGDEGTEAPAPAPAPVPAAPKAPVPAAPKAPAPAAPKAPAPGGI